MTEEERKAFLAVAGVKEIECEKLPRGFTCFYLDDWWISWNLAKKRFLEKRIVGINPDKLAEFQRLCGKPMCIRGHFHTEMGEFIFVSRYPPRIR